MDSEKKEFDLKDIITNSMKSTREVSSVTFDYFISLSEERLVHRLTPSQTRDVARELLNKLGLVSLE